MTKQTNCSHHEAFVKYDPRKGKVVCIACIAINGGEGKDMLYSVAATLQVMEMVYPGQISLLKLPVNDDGILVVHEAESGSHLLDESPTD